MSKKVLLATEKAFSQGARDEVVGILKGAGYTVALLENYKGKAEFVGAIADCEAVIVRSDAIDEEVLAAAKKLKLVVRAGAGYDTIDCVHAKERGVAVMNTPGQNANAVAELAFGMMIYMARGKFDGKTGTELHGKTLGLHACGAVGRQVARIAGGFGMRIRAFDPYVDAATLKQLGAEAAATVEELYKSSDYLSIHTPLTAQTKQSVGETLLSLLPKGACVVNTARKEIINEPELLAVFAKRADLRYASDVEPNAETLAALKAKFADRIYFTPKKMGAQTNEANVNAGLAAARQIVGFFERGDKSFIVNA